MHFPSGRFRLLQQRRQLLPDFVHLHVVVGLLEEHIPLRGPNHEKVVRESKLPNLLPCVGGGRVDIPGDDLSGELLLEPAHGRLHFRADGSAGQEEVGHLDRLRRRLLGSGGLGGEWEHREKAEPHQQDYHERSSRSDLHGPPPGRRVEK